MTRKEVMSGTANGDVGISDSADSSSRTADETSDDGASSPSSTKSSGLRAPEEQEVLSTAAAAAVHEDEALSQTGQKAQDSVGVPIVTMARAYQLEMCEESMRRNIIAVMDTGSGKTHVSVLRIEKELERMSSTKMIWFLAPTVTLCEQQFKVITRQIPSVQVKLLTGDDGVDSWSSEELWAEFLLNVKIVVSTYQILYDALSHVFVKLDSLALIIFDEAHNCVGKHPGRKIMTGIYQRYKQEGYRVPHILGLTASPSMSSTKKDLVTLEETLDAICRTPIIHREELLARVKRPTVRFATYTDAGLAMNMAYPPSLASLGAIYHGLKIGEDPFIQHLASKTDERSRRKLREAVMKKDTFVQNQMKQLVRASRKLLTEIGLWAMEFFISGTIDRFISAQTSNPIGGDTLKAIEKDYLAQKLREVACRHLTSDELPTMPLSDKVTVLLRHLASQESDTVGIVFAEERIKVSILAHLISMHPLTKDRYKVGSAVGGSSYGSRKSDLSELWGQDRDLDGDLEKFRSGKLNLLVATSVLEEGIDVPVCNLVLCFDKPQNLKSFVQRRGRARKKDSKLIILSEASAGLPKNWEQLAAELRKQYEDEQRERANITRLEAEEHDRDEFILRSECGAEVDMDTAKQHLDHFCRVLSPREFVDSRPVYVIRKREGTDAPLLSAEVSLPVFIPVNVRTSRSAKEWKSEKNATKDAAFQAYLALYENGLLSGNLLPFKSDNYHEKIEPRAAIIQISNLHWPWGAVADAWSRRGLTCHLATLRNGKGKVVGQYSMTVPAPVTPPPHITVYPEDQEPWMVEFGPPLPYHGGDPGHEADHTTTLLNMTFGHRHAYFREEKQHIVSFAAKDETLATSQIGGRRFDGGIPEQELQFFLIRDQWNHPFVYDAILRQKPEPEQVRRLSRDFAEAPSDVPYLSVTKWFKRTDLLHQLKSTAKHASTKLYEYVLPVTCASVDEIPVRHGHFARLIPCIMHELEVQFLAAMVSQTLLSLSPGVQISDLNLVRTAISPLSSNEPVNYERIELLGDSVLKTCTAVNVAALYPGHPEGNLSFFRDKRVSNSYLSRACVERGLDAFILDKPFTGLKWRPVFVDEVGARAEEAQAGQRKMSTKTLADVVEALIGAAHVDGGVSKAIECINTLLPDKEWDEWISVEKCRQGLYDIAAPDVTLPSTMVPLERLIGYSFCKKALLIEAMTHASCVATPFGSLERLEFIGDAILDYLVVTKLFEVSPPLQHSKMHRLKTAMVNGDFQAFLVMETCALQEATEITKDLRVERSEFVQPLWAFMMHTSTVMGVEQSLTKARHAEMRGKIIAALDHSPDYPWALLSRLRARKFYSDLFESLLGAVWVDSGCMKTCEALIERLGLLKYMERFLRDGVEVTHPKEQVGHLAGDRRVRYDIDMRQDAEREKVFTCQVFVGEELKAEVTDGVDKEEVKTKAAEVAVRVMKKELREAKGGKEEVDREAMDLAC